MGLGPDTRNCFPKLLGEPETIRLFRADDDVSVTRHRTILWSDVARGCDDGHRRCRFAFSRIIDSPSSSGLVGHEYCMQKSRPEPSTFS